MQRSRLKNIINKSKGFSNQQVGDPYDLFVNSLPSELDYYKDGGKYRLKAAWKAYGEPKNYQEALWNGLVETIGDKFSMPSIGYNKESDSYEYLNTGRENDTVAKDIRVWDNDIIPFVKELKLGGYVRIFDEEQNCWKYSKNPQTEEKSIETIESNNKTINEEVETFKSGGQMNVIPDGALHCRKNNMELAKEGEVTPKGIPVVSEQGGEIQQQAEIEREEIIYSKSATDTIEKAYKQYKETSDSKEQDEIAIKIGKFITKEIIENTQDNTGLIQDIKQKM